MFCSLLIAINIKGHSTVHCNLLLVQTTVVDTALWFTCLCVASHRV